MPWLRASRFRQRTLRLVMTIAIGLIGWHHAGAQIEPKPDAVRVDRFTKKDEQAEFRVKKRAGDSLSVRVVGLGEDEHRRFVVNLLDKNGETLRQSNVGNGIAFLPTNRAEIRGVILPEDGTYTIRVENHGEPGTYRLEVGFVGRPIKPGQPVVEGRADARDREEYKIAMEAGDRLSVVVEGPEGSRWVIKVFGQDTQTILRQSNVGNGIGFIPSRRAVIDSLTLPDHADYVIQVENAGPETASYLLQVGAILRDGKRVFPPAGRRRRR